MVVRSLNNLPSTNSSSNTGYESGTNGYIALAGEFYGVQHP